MRTTSRETRHCELLPALRIGQESHVLGDIRNNAARLPGRAEARPTVEKHPQACLFERLDQVRSLPPGAWCAVMRDHRQTVRRAVQAVPQHAAVRRTEFMCLRRDPGLVERHTIIQPEGSDLSASSSSRVRALRSSNWPGFRRLS
jgi:hypothetical protein